MRVLVTGTTTSLIEFVRDRLIEDGIQALFVPQCRNAVIQIEADAADAVVFELPEQLSAAWECLSDLRMRMPQIPVVVVTCHPSLETAIGCLRLGVSDYLSCVGEGAKCHGIGHEFVLAVWTALSQREAKCLCALPQPAEPVGCVDGLVGQSEAMKKVFREISRIANSSASVLISGETGTGKELAARALHELSGRHNRPFRIVDCGAIPDTLFESLLFGHTKGAYTGAVSTTTGLLRACDGGTLLFDEIGELPLAMQPKLLRVLEQKTILPIGSTQEVSIQARILASTNRNLLKEVKQGRFREDLYYRLAVVRLHLPPLRKRSGDVPVLVQHFIRQLLHQYPNVTGVTHRALACLEKYRWPGNVRQLKNVIDHAMITGRMNRIRMVDLPPEIRQRQDAAPWKPPEHSSQSLHDSHDQAETQYLQDLLKCNHGNVTKAARQAGVSRQRLHQLLTKHGVQASRYRSLP